MYEERIPARSEKGIQPQQVRAKESHRKASRLAKEGCDFEP